MVPPPHDDTSLDKAERIDRICSEFEARWRRGDAPPIEAWLEGIEPESRPTVLRELVAIEVELRRARGEAIDPDDWERRFPGVGKNVAAAPAGEGAAGFEAWLDSRARAAALRSDAPNAGPPREAPPLPPRFEMRRTLGAGSFGTVFLAFDRHLRRLVAVKCIHADRLPDDRARAMLRREARLTARLGHPGIVEVLEVLEDESALWLVQEFLSGGDLAARVRPGGLPVRLVAEWMATAAEAVAFAHQRDVFHRDLKPANILLDDRGRPRVADFGLAILDDDRLDPSIVSRRSGTIAYMSPEQVRGESHRLDGRSDTWSLGVVLYELLTGRRPFRGTREQVIEQIRAGVPRPPRELRPEIPAELERVCLKCLARSKASRYSTAADLAADLRRWMADAPASVNGLPAPRSAPVVPRGLCAFDPRDHDGFLGLLPGPRDSDGIPECIRFWKEAVEASPAVPVGVIHGPSGCGKSSLVRAGLVPCLAPSIMPVVVEATANDTEARILAALRLRVPELDPDLDLPAALAALRSGRAAPRQGRVLLVIDQFEQWLDGRSHVASAPLVDGLRQCDGARLQALLVVRDDFWPALLRLCSALDMSLDPARNARPVEPFDARHARRVLALFGAAHGALPADPDRIGARESAFLDAAIETVGDHGRVRCVHLALLAVLLRDRPWVPATLERAGGARGLVCRFLEATFDPAAAPPGRRRHAAGVKRLLTALLPPAGSPIRGTSVPRERLREVAGYADDPRGFDDLLEWLDGDLRIVTPTVSEAPGPAADADPERSPTDGATLVTGYHLTHDFLVQPVREWLDAGTRATPRGRARHLLAERSALWEAHPTDRLLPGPWEHARIRWHSRAAERSAGEARYLRRAAAFHLRQGGAVGLVVLLVFSGLWVTSRAWRGAMLAERARERVAALSDSRPERWAGLIDELGSVEMRPVALPLLASAAVTEGGEPAEALPRRLARLVLLGDHAELPAIREALFSADADAIREVRSKLRSAAGPAAFEPLWKVALAPSVGDTVLDSEPAESRSMRAALAVAASGPADERWNAIAPRVAARLVRAGAEEAVAWRALLEPVRHRLVPSLSARFETAPAGSDERAATLESLLWAARDDGRALAAALLASDPQSFGRLIPVAAAVVDDVLPELRRELARPDVSGAWPDPPGLAPWSPPDDVAAEIVAAEGEIHPAFAFCLALPVERLVPLCERLRPGGYRPVSIETPKAGSSPRGVVMVCWHRDGLPWALEDDLPVDRALAEDRRQAALGHMILALEDLGPGRSLVLWGPHRVWGRPYRRAEGPPVRLEERVEANRSSPERWKVTYLACPHGPPADGADLATVGAGPPLLEGEFSTFIGAHVALARRSPGLPRDLAMVAEAEFMSDGDALMIGASSVQGLRVRVDGDRLATLDRGAEASMDVRPLPLELPAGRHTLRVEMWWKEFDTRSSVVIGTVQLGSTTSVVDVVPEWLLESLGPADPESMAPLQPAFDFRRIDTSAPTSLARVREEIGEGFRPCRVESNRSLDLVAIDLCRPRPVADDVDTFARRRARAALALLELDRGSDVWGDVIVPALGMRPQPSDPDTLDATVATEMMFALAEYPLPRSLPWNRLADGSAAIPADVRHRLWIALGIAGTKLTPAAREAWSRRLDIPRRLADETDAAIHGALGWLCRAWGVAATAPAAPRSGPPAPAEGTRPVRWSDPRGQEFTLFPPGSATLGGTDPVAVLEGRGRRAVRIDRPFALATTCVTHAQYQRYRRSRHGETSEWERTSSHPNRSSWIDAVRYLNWLSDQDGLERCYEFTDRGEVVIPPDSLARDGYRLPTSAEWECAARAGTGNDWIHGSTPTRLGEFAWFAGNRGETWSRPVGGKLPNPAGLFDMQGNEEEWVHDDPSRGAGPEEPISGSVIRGIRDAPASAHWNGLRVHMVMSAIASTPAACLRIARTLRGGDLPASIAIPVESAGSGRGGDGEPASPHASIGVTTSSSRSVSR